jgi:hypothetical protein
MKYEIDRAIDVDVPGHVVADELEIPFTQMRDVGRVSGEQVVDADDLMATVEERFAQMGSDKPGRASDDNAHGVRSAAGGRERR